MELDDYLSEEHKNWFSKGIGCKPCYYNGKLVTLVFFFLILFNLYFIALYKQ